MNRSQKNKICPHCRSNNTSRFQWDFDYEDFMYWTCWDCDRFWLIDKEKKMKTIAVDFDGVIASYEGYKGYGVFGAPVDLIGIITTLKYLRESNWKIIIYTARSEIKFISEYLDKYNIPYDFINHNPKNAELHCSPCKPVADVYLDDRAITFNGNWVDIINKIENFKPWWKK